jgi:hypothetical protein
MASTDADSSQVLFSSAFFHQNSEDFILVPFEEVIQ